MAIITMVSATGAPGVSTAALACTLSWPDPVVLAECDPSGGVILPGYLARLSIPGGHGLFQLAKADLRDQLAGVFWSQLIDLDAPRGRLALPGIADPAQAATLDRLWPRVASLFAGLEHVHPGYDVIADCGRVSAAHFPWPLLTRADGVLLVVRPTTLRALAPAASAVALLRRRLVEAAATDSALGLLTVGEEGDYRFAEVARQLGVPVIAQLPEDRRTAAALCGTGAGRGGRELLRHAASANDRIRTAIAAHRTRLGHSDRMEVYSGRQ